VSGRFDPNDFDGPMYGTISEALAAAAEAAIGQPWTFKGDMRLRVGEEVVLGLQGGIDLIGRVDAVDEGGASGVIVSTRPTPEPTLDCGCDCGGGGV